MIVHSRAASTAGAPHGPAGWAAGTGAGAEPETGVEDGGGGGIAAKEEAKGRKKRAARMRKAGIPFVRVIHCIFICFFTSISAFCPGRA